MYETLSPYKSPAQKQSRIQSPTTAFFLGSNDDKLERAQARAARAAAIRRKPLPVDPSPAADPNPFLCKDQILELFQNCIKLASENKINQKNTWELGLIDHLYELVKVEEEDDTETNFQKASCTLEAGVKIYSLRVDSVHSEAYKVLGGINRVGQENEQVTTAEDGHVDNGQEEGHPKKERKLSPLSTLETSFEALNVKKFDVAFAVDPLYHQTSAQFDEGGAKGLLLNNLGVYGGCRVLFDSMEVPGKCTSSANPCDKSDTIDLSFVREYVDQMVFHIQTKNEISPTLRIIINQFDEDNRKSMDTLSSGLKPAEQVDMVYNDEVVFDDVAFDNSETWTFDHDEHTSVVDDESTGVVQNFSTYNEENEQFSLQEPYMDDAFEKVEGYLFSSLGFTSKSNSWAGPDHWKYRKAKGSEDVPATENGSPITTKGRRVKKQPDIDIDFTKALEKEMPDIFAPPKSSKSLLLPANRTPCNTKLPEDCHYQPENLVKLFLLPNIMCLGRRGRKSSDESRQQSNSYGSLPSWDDDSAFEGQYDDGNVNSDVEDLNTLVSQPRQVNKIDVQYDKNSKQVDVQALKETLWDHIQESPQKSCQVEEEMISFKNILANFPTDCRAAGTIEEISPHLCFICLLHLANEHGLSIHGCTNLDDLSIYLPHNDT